MNSPFNALGLLGGGLAKPLIEGFKNRKEYGGGLKGIVKSTGAQITGEHEDNKLDAINEKLDKLVGTIDEQTQDVNQDPAMQNDMQNIATPLNFKEFMTTTQQNPATNGTGSARAVFGDVRPMSVADPNIDTKSSLFNKKQNY